VERIGPQQGRTGTIASRGRGDKSVPCAIVQLLAELLALIVRVGR